MSEDTSNNALGLDFAANADSDLATTKKEKEKPYINPERVRTGGPQRDKLSEEALQERMARIREQNEKIKQRRLDVQADEEAFRKTQEAERVKQAESRKMQADIDRARDQNAKRKMEKVQNREWDSGKGTADRRGPPQRKADNHSRSQSASNQPPKQSNSTKPTPSKPASSKPTSNVTELPANEPSSIEPSSIEPTPEEPTPEEPTPNEPIFNPSLPEIPVSADIFSQGSHDYGAWSTVDDTSVPKEAFTDAFSPAAQEKPDYSEWFTGDSSNTTQNYSDWFIDSALDQSSSQSGTQTGNYQSLNNRGNDRGRVRGRGRGRGRGDTSGGRGSNNGARRGTGNEAHRHS